MGCELGKLTSSSLDDRNPLQGKSVPIQPPPVNMLPMCPVAPLHEKINAEWKPPPPPDPRLPLTVKQKYIMMASWKGISRAMETTGIFMFVKLFEENEELIQLFDKFRELRTRDQQVGSLELAEHATAVMTSLDESIKAMDNLDYFFDFLHQVGQTHRKIPGFSKEFFWKIEGPFLHAVETTLGDRYTENVETIYKTSVKLIIETLVSGYEDNNGKSEVVLGGTTKVPNGL